MKVRLAIYFFVRSSRNVAESKGAYRINVEADLKPLEMIAEGGAAQIFTATVVNPTLKQRLGSDGDMVVVKLLKEQPNIKIERIRAAFQQEVAIMWLLSHHRSFIKFLGYSSEPMAFVSRNYKYGPLSRHIYRVTGGGFTLPDEEYTSMFMLDMACDIAAGLKEMHDRGIIHNDVKVIFTMTTSLTNPDLCW